MFLLSTNNHGSPEPAKVWPDGARSGGHPSPWAARSPCQQMGGFSVCQCPPEPVCSGTPVLEEDAMNCFLLPGCHRCASWESPRGRALPILAHHLGALGDGQAVAWGTHRLSPPCHLALAAHTCWGHNCITKPTCPPVSRAACVPVLCSGEYGPYNSYSGVALRMRKFIAKIGNLALPQGKRKGNDCFIPRVVFVRAVLSKG